ncbi:hypothetical protein FQN55_001649 [Onygenales sp. PD_40]|nr:hypothetical protein FQN55_001649 [Onygenales sp. PD_40]
MGAQHPPFTLSHEPKENDATNTALKRWADALEGVPAPVVLPPGITEETWKGILAEFKKILGEDSVVVEAEKRQLHYDDPFAFLKDESEIRGSSCALLPTTVEQIQAILKIANEHKIPLWTFSRGKNLGYGGPAGRVKGCIAIDLQNMDKVIEVNDKYSYYTVEPGVSFFKLYKAIQEENKNIWCSVPALGWGSVLGNALDRVRYPRNQRLHFESSNLEQQGWGYTPNGDHSNQICGIEVVLADGSIVRTGMGGLDNSKCWPLFRGGYGPTYDSMFNQSNFGIVTKMSLWASPAPEGFMSCHADFENETDLAAVVDTFRELLMKEAIQNHPVIGNITREIGRRGCRKQFFDGDGAIPYARLKELQKEFGCGFWDTNFGLYGPREIIEANYKRCEAAILKIPGAKLRGNAYYPKEGQELLKAEDVPPGDRFCQTGVPTMVPIHAVKYRAEDGGHISFSPVLPPDGKEALDFYYTAKASCAKYGFDFVAGLHLYHRHLTHINMIYFDRQCETNKENANKLFVQLVKDARQAGYGEYRAHVEHMDLVAQQYDYRGGSLMKLNELIKDTLDPNGILSPGKQGIWPKRWREERLRNGVGNLKI